MVAGRPEPGTVRNAVSRFASLRERDDVSDVAKERWSLVCFPAGDAKESSYLQVNYETRKRAEGLLSSLYTSFYTNAR